MPTLRPQKVSGLVVTPTVDHQGSLYRASIAFDVGQSRSGSPPPDVVTREDLVVELRHPVEGSFEAIASPDPGPLPVRALRVMQARGDFTFSQGVNNPTELVVNLRGDQKTFPMAQTFAPGGCPSKEPQEGDPFPTSRAAGGGILQRLQVLWPPLKPRCCVKRFEAPLNVIADAAVKSEDFEIAASFGPRTPRSRGCQCNCCEYRQYVRGTFSDAAAAPVRFDMPSGALDPTTYCEDGSIDEFGPGKPGYYGHRGTSSPGDTYSGAGATKGCSYSASETVRCPTSEGVHLDFLGLIVDRCRGRVVAARKWTVDL
jgi:hypothetical protein